MTGTTPGTVSNLTSNLGLQAYETQCTLPASSTVTLPTVHSSDFDANGRAAKMRFYLPASNCQSPSASAYTNVMATWTYTQQEANVIQNSASGGSSNVGCVVTAVSTGSAIPNGGNTIVATATTSSFALSSFIVEYQRYSTATVAAVGAVTCPVTLTLTYG